MTRSRTRSCHLRQHVAKFAVCASLAVTAALAVSGSTHAQWTTPPVTAPGLQYRTFQSTAAATTVSFHIYLPPQYSSQPTARFPVLYWLHGSGNGTLGIDNLANYFGTAMAQGRIPPMLIVFPNGMAYSMWCDSKDGDVPMESVVIDDLIPHVDANFRTIARRSGRILDGFSMGGQGAGRLGLRRPDLFAGVSMLGAGPIQLDFLDAPKGKSTPPKLRLQIYEDVWGSDPAYYLAQHPWTIAIDRAEALIASQTKIRQGIGSLDALVPMNVDFDAHLADLGIPHQYAVVPGGRPQPLRRALGARAAELELLQRGAGDAVQAGGGHRLQRRRRCRRPLARSLRLGRRQRARRSRWKRFGRCGRPRARPRRVGRGRLRP